MRWLLVVSLLTLACSTKTSPPDAQGQTDTNVDVSVDVAAESIRRLVRERFSLLRVHLRDRVHVQRFGVPLPRRG